MFFFVFFYKCTNKRVCIILSELWHVDITFKITTVFLTYWFGFKILKILDISTISLFKISMYQYDFLTLTIENHMFYFLFAFTTYTDTIGYLIISKASEETGQSAIYMCR